jgi:hypothetical protein
MSKKREQPETVYFTPQVLMSVEDVANALDLASQDFIFALIVQLEKNQADGDFLERVWAHFDAEVQKQRAEPA